MVLMTRFYFYVQNCSDSLIGGNIHDEERRISSA